MGDATGFKRNWLPRFVLIIWSLMLAGCGSSAQPARMAASVPPRATSPPVPTQTRPAPTLTPMPTLVPTSTVASAKGNFSFAVCGDSRNGDEIYSQILSKVMADRSDFLVNTGDLVSNGSPDNFAAFRGLMRAFTKPFYPVPGNHDLYAGQLTEFLRLTPGGQPHYSFDYGRAHFAIANSSLGDLSPLELGWLDNDLSTSAQPLKMIFLHHPPFDPQRGSHVLVRGGAELVSLATRHQVKYVFAGHIHGYARETRGGVTYIVTGGGGAPLYYPPENGGFYHYVRVSVMGEEVRDEVVRVSAP